jgi:hypothetical protein
MELPPPGAYRPIDSSLGQASYVLGDSGELDPLA